MVDQNLLRWIRSQRVPHEKVVRAQYRRALYLDGGTQRMVVLQSQDEPVGPSGVVVAVPEFDASWQGSGFVTRTSIHIGSHVISLDHARPWDNMIVSVKQWQPQALQGMVSKLWATGDVWGHIQNAPLRRRLRSGMEAVFAALRGSDPIVLQEAVLSLIGLGEGSTPMGDDLLVGLIVGLSIERPGWAKRVRDAIPSLTVLSARTTLPSVVALSSAAHGQVFSLINETVRWLSAPNAEDEESVLLLAQRGQTSGLDLLAGLVMGATGQIETLWRS